jgi:hypothetical protein
MDVVLAIPAMHYKEYSPTLNLYSSRLYFSETRGGVLGANAMQGHNVLFDWHHQRIGFSQSSCAYDLISEEHVNFSSETFGSHCVLKKGPPILTTACMESSGLDVSICQAVTTTESDQDQAAAAAPNNVQLIGTEVWTRIVESPGSLGNCQELVEEELSFKGAQDQQQVDDSVVNCTLDGLCHEYRPCQVPCLEAIEYYNKNNNVKKKKDDDAKTTTTTNTNSSSHTTSETAPSSSSSTNEDCGDSFWSACDYNCQQSRIVSSFDVDENVCKEVSRSTRDCHVDACGRSDPCVVPFLVHAILVLEYHSSVENWTLASLDAFSHEFVRVAHLPEFSSSAANRQRTLFHPGDVDVLVVRPWYDDDDEEFDDHDQEEDKNHNNATQVTTRPTRQALGIQLILQVSIFNPNAQQISTPSTTPVVEENRGRHLLQEIGVLWTNLTKPFRTPQSSTTCDTSSDLYALAKDAMELANGILEHENFGTRLVQDMPSYHKGRVISAWTIGTQVYDEYVNYLGPIGMTPYLLLFRVLFESSLVFLVISIVSMCLQRLARWRYWHWGCISSRRIRQLLPFYCCRSWLSWFSNNTSSGGSRYQSVPADDNGNHNDGDDDSLTDKIMGTTTSYSSAAASPPKHPVKEVELHSFSDIHKKAGATTTKRRNSLSID